jgi:hypothetical protein
VLDELDKGFKNSLLDELSKDFKCSLVELLAMSAEGSIKSSEAGGLVLEALLQSVQKKAVRDK